jgi:hypothetical protein
MNHCLICQQDFSDDTPMVRPKLWDRSDDMCVPCAETETGRIVIKQAQPKPDDPYRGRSPREWDLYWKSGARFPRG